MAPDGKSQSEKRVNAPSGGTARSWFEPKLHVDPLCRVVLIEPLIPENTGNISRTCVATNSELHLVGPLGFDLTESRVLRAGLDYWKDLAWQRHVDTRSWQDSIPEPSQNRVFFIETGSKQCIYDAELEIGDWIVFGKETSGIDKTTINDYDARAWSIPMPGKTRSLNLSNAVAIVVFELLRQVRKSSGRAGF